MTTIKFDLASFEPVPEGERILEITKAECKPSGKPTEMSVTFKDILTNRTLVNRYNFSNAGGLTAMAIMCRIALGLEDMDTFDTIKDTPKLIGRRLKCEIVHNQGTQPREDGTYATFANIKRVIELVNDNQVNIPSPNASPRQTIIGNDLD